MYKDEFQAKEKARLTNLFKADNTPIFIQRYFISFFGNTRSSTTAKNYYYTLKDFFEWILQKDELDFGHFTLAEMTPADFELIDRTYVEEYLYSKEAEGLSHNSICTRKNVLSSFWEYLVDLPTTNINKNIVQKIKYCPDTTDNIIDKLPTDEEIRSLFTRLAMSKKVLDFYVFRVLIGTGMRKSELVNLDLSDVFLEGSDNDPERKPYVRILDKGRYRETQKRIAYLTRDAADAIRQWLSVRENIDVIDTEALFVCIKGKTYGKRISTAFIDRIFYKNSEITPHQARHWYATTYSKIISVEFVRQQCGHMSIATTTSYYANGSSGISSALAENPLVG